MAGRPRSFDKDQALLIAIERFWRDGYEATTIATLTEAMGINAPSLYAAFGDKDRLFAQAAACYVERISIQVANALDRPSTRDAVTALLGAAAEGMAVDGAPRGCFMLSERRLGPPREEIRRQIRARLEQGRAEGDLPATLDPHAVANYLLAVLTGMSSRARDGAATQELEAIAEVAAIAIPATE